MIFLLSSRGLQLGEDQTNGIKNEIQPEKWVQRDRFIIKKYGDGVYDDMLALTCIHSYNTLPVSQMMATSVPRTRALYLYTQCDLLL